MPPPRPAVSAAAAPSRWPIVAALSAIMFSRMLGVFLILPVAAVLAGSMAGASPYLIGLALGGYGLTQALMQIPTGMLADRFGRKPVLLAALALFTAGGFCAALADDITGIIAGRLLQGAGAMAAAATAWIADITAAKERARAMALFGGGIGAAFVAALFIAPPLADAAGARGVFTFAAWLGGGAFLCALFLPPPAQTRAPAAAPMRALIADKTLRFYAGGGFVLHYAMAAVFLLLPPLLPPPLAEHWRIYAGAFAASALLFAPLLAAAGKYARPTMTAAVAAMIAGAGVIAAAPDAAFAALFFFFGGFVAMEAILPAEATKAAPDAHRAAAVGIVLSAEFAGVFAGGLVSGFLQQAFGSTIAALFVCALLAAWAAFLKKPPAALK